MAPPFRPVFADVLRIEQTLRNWNSEQLARRGGITVHSLHRYEGHQPPPPETAEQLRQEMGFPPWFSSKVAALVEEGREILGLPQSGAEGDGAGDRRTRRAAALLGGAVERFVIEAFDFWQREQQLALDEKEAERLWLHLARHSGFAARRAAIEAEKELHSWALAVLLCERSREAAADKPDPALELAELAVFTAEQVEEPGTFCDQLRSYCWSALANARRVKGRLPWADEAFRRADGFWDFEKDPGSGVLSAARVLSLKASLRRAQRRFPEALALIERAIELGSEEERVDLLLNQVFIQSSAGDLEGALTPLQQVLNLPNLTRRQEFAARNNQIEILSQLERFAEARKLLPAARRLAHEGGNSLDLLRLRWVEASLAARSGALDRGIALLEAVRSDLVESKLWYDFALATLELAVYLLQQGQIGRVKRWALQLVPAFDSQEVHREAAAALRLFCEAAGNETLTLHAAQRFFRYLRAARADRELRFEAFEAGSG